MNDRHIRSGSNPNRRCTKILSAADCSLSTSVGFTRMANENCVSLASETRVTDAEYSLSERSRMAARPSAKVGNR